MAFRAWERTRFAMPPSEMRPIPEIKNVPEVKFTSLDFKQADADGSFEGYASLFNREDLGRDVVLPGAFRESLARRGARGIKLLFQHDANQPIGVWTTLQEDSRGLYAQGRLMREVGEVSGEETLIRAATRHLVARGKVPPEPGDILIFRMRAGAIAKHAAILATPTTMVHAMEDRLAAEIPFSPWWRRRLAAVFSFPGSVSKD